MDEREKRSLAELAEELAGRGWGTDIGGRAGSTVLTVTNPADATMAESIVCVNSDGGLVYRLPGGQTIGSVADVQRAADTIQHVLRSVGR